MSGRVIVVQASSSEDESMGSPIASGGDKVMDDEKDETVGGTGKNFHRYDREDMLKLYHHPLAKVRPSVLSPEFDMVVQNGEGGDSGVINKLWSPELWIQSIWNPEPRQISGGGPNHGWSGRRQGDHEGHGQPTGKKKQIDRLKTESEDGIILSPQRRSFGAGCQVASSSAAATGNPVATQGASAPASQIRRSASPINAGGDERQQQPSQNQNARSSFRSRGASNVVNSSTFPHQVYQSQLVAAGTYGRGDRVENWRDRSTFSSSSFGRGNAGKDGPAAIGSYGRSRGSGSNGANYMAGGNRRSYGGGGYNQQGEESLPEWVTEGPSDMYETMELRGFDEEERAEMQLERNEMGKRSVGGPQQLKLSTGNDSDRIHSNRRSIDREQHVQSKKDNLPMATSGTRKTEKDKMVKMPAEALADCFDIGDMAQFLSVAGADFDSIANGEIAVPDKSSFQNKLPSASSTVASRFSKFFSHSGQIANGRSPEDKKPADVLAQKGPQQSQQLQSVNIMELLSRATVTGDSGHARSLASNPTVSTAVPAGAKSLDEIEAAFKSSAAQKSQADGTPIKVLQQLFQSARTSDVPHGAMQDTRWNAESQQKGDDKTTGDVEKLGQVAPDQMTQQQAMEYLQKGQQNMVNAGGIPTAKGNPLADPVQQQHFLDALRKLQFQQQFPVSQQPHGEANIRLPNGPTAVETASQLLATYPQLAGLQHLLQQQQQAAQLVNFQASMKNAGRVPSPLGVLPGVTPPQQGAGVTGTGQPINPAFVGFLPPNANVPPPPITQQDLLLAHTQTIYQRALMARKLQHGIEEHQIPPPKATVQHPIISGSGKLPTAFLPTSVIKQMHGGGKTNKESGEESASAAVRAIVKQQVGPSTLPQQEQISPNSVNEQVLRVLQQQQNTNKPGAPGVSPVPQQPVAPPPSLTPQDLQRLIDQSHLQQRQRVLLEQYAKAQQQQSPQPSGGANQAAAMNPAAVQAALTLQNNPLFVQMLRAQQLAMLQQQATVALGSGLSPAAPQPIPASTAVSAIPNAAQLVRARLNAPPGSAAQPPNPELMRHVLQQQQQLLLNQLRQQSPGDAHVLNRLLTGQAAQMQGVPPQTASLAGIHFPAQTLVDAKPMTMEELERLHKPTIPMQQPQS